MSTQLLTHIQQLVNVRTDDHPLYGKEMAVLPCLENAWLLIEGKEIVSFGKMDGLKNELPNLPEEEINCSGRLVMPAWCDSHTHLVFAGSRELDFVDKIRGMDYAEINARGGGILSTVRQIDSIPEDELFRLSWLRLRKYQKGEPALWK